MFINCPYCRALVATNPVTDEPPEQCPRCAATLRAPKAEALPGGAVAADEPLAADRSAEDRGAEAESAEAALADAGPADEASGAADPVEWAALADEAEAAAPAPAPAATRTPAATPTPTPTPATAPAAEEPAGEDVTPAGDAAAQSGAEWPLPAADVEPALDDGDSAPPPVAEPGDPAATRAERRSHKRAPSFVRAPRAAASPPARHAWRTPAAITLLACTLVLQLLLADRASLAESKRWRPLITSLCAALQCSVPPWREVAAFTLLQRDVRPHPSRSGALRVTASFRNDATWPQPWPRLVLTLSDSDGREAGTRSFTANEYLGAAPMQPELQSGQTATIAMDVLEPAPRIVAFTFDFN